MKNEKNKNQGIEIQDTTKPTRDRRKVIKSVAAIGGGLAIGESIPDKWHRPLVDAVLLPAHAQTSNVEGGGSQSSAFGGSVGVTVASNSLGRDRSNSLASTLADIVVSPAHAHSGTVTVLSGCANLEGNSVSVSLDTSESSTLGGQGQLGEEISLSPNPAGSIRDAFITLTTVTDSNVSPSVTTQMEYDLVFDIVDETSDTTHAGAGPGAHGKVGTWGKLESSC